LGGDILMTEAFYPAHPEDGLLLIGELGKGIGYQLLAFPGIQLEVKGIGGYGDVCPDLVYQLLLAGYLTEMIDCFVAGNDKDIITNVFDNGELFATGP
jgi:hypothetical protein